MKRTLCMLAALVVALAAMAFPACAAGKAVSIGDVNLEGYIRKLLDKPQGDITQEDAGRVTYIDFAAQRDDKDDVKIQNIAGLEAFVNLEELILPFHRIRDIRPLAGLKKLKRLSLANNAVEDIKALSGLAELTYLDLYNNRLSSVKPLSKLKNLEYLDIGFDFWGSNYQEGSIKDIGALSGMKKLVTLKIDFNQIADISVLSRLSSLKTLSMDGIAAKNWKSLYGLKDVESLRLWASKSLDMERLGKLTSLKGLTITGSKAHQLTDMGFVANLTSLTQLELRNHQISDISPLAGLDKLRDLSVCFNQIADIKPLSGLTGLSNIDISSCQVADLSPLAELKELKTLKLDKNPIEDFGPVADMYSRLEEKDFELPYDLQAGGTKAADVVFFNDTVLETKVRKAMNRPEGDVTVAQAAAVEHLSLQNDSPMVPDGEKIQKINALRYFTNLKTLDLSWNNITNLSPLAGMTHLEALYLNGNGSITNFEPLAGLLEMKDFMYVGALNIDDGNVGFLKDMAMMELLWISDASRLTDISAVSGFPNLFRLNLQGCGVRDISPVAGLKNLKELTLEGNPISDFSPLKDIYGNLDSKDFKLK